MDAKLNSGKMDEKMDDGKSSLMSAPINSTVGQTAAPADLDLPTSEVIGAVSTSGSLSAERQQPQPLFASMPSSTEPRTVSEMSQSFTSINKSQQSLKTDTIQEEEDLCAAILLSCLFCNPLDCCMASLRGCNACLWSACSSLCGCESSALQPLLDLGQCEPCGCLDVHCVLCDCSSCEICLPLTECLDLAMEISQMLYH